MVRLICLLVLLNAVPQRPANSVGTQPSGVREKFAQAQQALVARDYAAAERAFREVIKLDPRSAAAYSDLGVVYLRTNRISSAIQSFETAQKLAPNEIGIDLNLGMAYYRQRDFEHAIPHFSRVFAANPGNHQARYLAGLCYFAVRDYKHTVETLAPLSDKEKHNIDFLFMQGISSGKLDQKAESQRAFDEMVRVGGQSPQFHLLLSKLYIDFFYNQQADLELNKAIAQNPNLPFAHYNLGVVYQRLGRLDKAVEEYKKEITISPREPWSYENLAKITLDRGSPDEAIPLFRHALSLYSKLSASWAGLGRAYSQKRQFDQAITCYHRALALDPDNAKFHYQLGQAYLKSGEKTAAQKEFAETRRLQMSSVERQAERLSGRLPEAEGSTP
jgi:tetratricopeptide (TPR) repeat protein